MLNYVEPAGSSANIPFLPISCTPQQTIIAKPLPATAQQERESGQGTVNVTNIADGFHRGVQWGVQWSQVCSIEDDLPEDYTLWFLDALFQARQTYPSGWLRREEQEQA
jgi:hypothetical protein